MEETGSQAPSDRTTLRRGPLRAVYDRQRIRSILAAGIVAHVGVNTDDGPIVLPMAYGVGEKELFLHGSVANAMLRAGRSVEVCVTVTIVDGLVVARTPFHNSMNYRSVVVRGEATALTETDRKLAALRIINDHVAPLWETARAPSDTDFAKTMVLSVPLTEASAKVRSGDPIDEDHDLDGPHWAGTLPLTSSWGEPIDADDLTTRAAAPHAVLDLAGTLAHVED